MAKDEVAMHDVIAKRTYHPYKDLFPQFEEDGPVTVFEKAEYIGTSPNQFDDTKPNFAFRVGDDEHILNACGHLNYQMDQVARGDLVTAVYLGKEKLTDGKFKGKESHQWKIRVGKVTQGGFSTDDNPFA